MLDRIIDINNDKRTIGAAYTDLYNQGKCGLAVNEARFNATCHSSEVLDHLVRPGTIEVVSVPN